MGCRGPHRGRQGLGSEKTGSLILGRSPSSYSEFLQIILAGPLVQMKKSRLTMVAASQVLDTGELLLRTNLAPCFSLPCCIHCRLLHPTAGTAEEFFTERSAFGKACWLALACFYWIPQLLGWHHGNGASHLLQGGRSIATMAAGVLLPWTTVRAGTQRGNKEGCWAAAPHTHKAGARRCAAASPLCWAPRLICWLSALQLS